MKQRNLRKSWFSALLDALPPYCTAEGRLDSKESGSNGSYYISVGPARVEVDSITYEKLKVGEWVKIRYTRNSKAISIDRLLPLENGSNGDVG
jgi:hypothetical protein